MKKFYLFISALLVVISINAQQRINTTGKLNFTGNQKQSMSLLKAPGDTTFLKAPAESQTCADDPSKWKLYTLTNGDGYATGTNADKHSEIAQRFDYTNGGWVFAVFIPIFCNTHSGETSVNIYSIKTGTNAPNNLVGSTLPLSLDTVTQDVQWFLFFPSSYISIPTKGFYTSLVLPTGSTDTLACFSSPIDCYGTKDLSWFKKSNVWYSYSDATNGFGVQFDLLMEPVVTIVSGTNDVKNTKLLYMTNVAPNPSKDRAVIGYTIPSGSDVRFAISDMTGREVLNQNLGYQKEGMHNINVDLSDFNSGIYFYSIKTNNGSLTKKMIINR